MGTKQKPCKECKYSDFDVWLNELDRDICFECIQASEWDKVEN